MGSIDLSGRGPPQPSSTCESKLLLIEGPLTAVSAYPLYPKEVRSSIEVVLLGRVTLIALLLAVVLASSSAAFAAGSQGNSVVDQYTEEGPRAGGAGGAGGGPRAFRGGGGHPPAARAPAGRA